MKLKFPEPNTDEEAHIVCILGHPLETDRDYIEIADLVEDDAAEEETTTKH